MWSSVALPYWINACSVEVVRLIGVLNQSSIVRGAFPVGKPTGDATWTYPLVPSRLNAWPTSPLAKLAPPTRVPLFPPTASLAFPSAFHQLTASVGGGVQAKAPVLVLNVDPCGAPEML